MSAKAAAEEAVEAARTAHRMTLQRRSSSMANLDATGGMHTRRAIPSGRFPNSMPEQQGVLMLSTSAGDQHGTYSLQQQQQQQQQQWFGLGSAGHIPTHNNHNHISINGAPQSSLRAAAGTAAHHVIAGSAPTPAWRQQPSLAAAAAPPPPTFSPVELRNMLHEESLELFESQSHLLDPESRVALQRQRQYLQWQSSLEDPGPMQSVLERQESAGSGCNDDDGSGGGDGDGSGGHVGDGSGDGAALHMDAYNKGQRQTGSEKMNGNYNNGGNKLLHDLQETRRHLAIVSREREALATRVHQLEAELQSQQEGTLCTLCRQVPRNCVALPCLHFTSCDGCFKKHCSSALSCPTCQGRVTGFQTLLML